MNIKHVKLVMQVETEPGKVEEFVVVDRSILPGEEATTSQSHGYKEHQKYDGTRGFMPNGDFSFSCSIKRTGG